jgi:hypothetical protein
MQYDNALARRRVRRCLTLAIATGAALLSSSGLALADSASISVTATDGTSDPAAGVPRTYTLSGNVASPKRYYVKYRATGGAACATSAYADSGRTLDGDYGTHWYGDEMANGNFSNSRAFTWRTPGTYLFCIWLATSDSEVVTPISQTITFRSPNGTISGTVNPVIPLPGQQATVTISGASEAPKRVYAKVRSEGAPCAQTSYADTGTSVIRDQDVNGSFSIQATTTQQNPGNYVICLWLASSDTDTAPVAGPQPVPFTVAAPPPPPCMVPSIPPNTRLASATRKLKVGHCTLGAVTRRYSRTVGRGKVIKSIPIAGTELAAGAPVAIVVSKGRKNRRRHG